MTVSEIQKAVEALHSDERIKLTAWMVSSYPSFNVEDLMSHAGSLVARGKWTPAPPTDDNRPTGRVLEHALKVAEEMDLAD